MAETLLEKFFSRRGYTSDFLQTMDCADHADLLSVDVLCESLHRFHESRERIVVLPDFDMDGIMSGTIGFAGLAELGFQVSLFIPDPNDGYGFTAQTVDRLLSEYPDAVCILTCDVGITCYDGIRHAKSKGLSVLVTDHHLQDLSCLSDLTADVVVDPYQVDETYAHPGICGAHVLYQVLEYYAQRYRSTDPHCLEQIRRLRVFAGIGTISDSMPLLYENRQLVRDAISICRLVYSSGDDWFVSSITGHPVYRRAFYGLYAALDMFADAGKISESLPIDETFFGYYLAPAFNSVKRMQGDMRKAFGVFFGPDAKGDMAYLLQLNEERKQTVDEYMHAIQLSLNAGGQPYYPYVILSDAPSGILGLLATALLHRTGMPTLVLASTGHGYRGSGRSPVWYNAHQQLTMAGFYAAGHAGAFGIGVTDARELKALHAFLQKDVADTLADLPDDAIETSYDILIATDGSGDTDIDIPTFAEFYHSLQRYRPFGQQFEEPVVAFRFRMSDARWTTMGSLKQHVKGTFRSGFELLCWNQATELDALSDDDVVTVYGRLGMNVFHERHTLHLVGNLPTQEVI